MQGFFDCSTQQGNACILSDIDHCDSKYKGVYPYPKVTNYLATAPEAGG